MREELIGVISEGKEDFGVLKNIFRAFGFDGSEIIPIRPSLNTDATDKHHNQQTIGTLQGVKNSCIGNDGKRPDFDRLLTQSDMKYIVVQIDTAEIDRQDFTFIKPLKKDNPNYATELRASVIKLINNWLSDNYTDQLLYAVTIEELESWCLTIFENDNTVYLDNLKQRLQNHLQRKNWSYKDLKCHPTTQKSQYFESFTQKSKFHKLKNLKEYAAKNQSLEDFITSIEQKLMSS
jgi:hypothetical protein